MIYLTHNRREALELIRVAPMTMGELAEITGKMREHSNRILLALERLGFVVRFGHMRAIRNNAAVWHWTGKDFGVPVTSARIAQMQAKAASLPDQMLRFELGVEIALRLDGMADRAVA